MHLAFAPRFLAFVCALAFARVAGSDEPAEAPSKPGSSARSDDGMSSTGPPPETSDADSIRRRWIPAFSTGLVVAEDRVEGAIDSSIGFSDAGAIGTTVARLELGLDLMSPALRRLPLEPRLVGFAGLQVKGPNEENESAGAGERPSVPSLETQIANAEPSMATGEFPPPESFDNQGSTATSEYGTLGWVLGLGLVFEFPQRENEDPALRVRPYVTYVGETIEFRGGVADVVGRPVGNPPVGSYTIRQGFVSEEEILHMLGPGLDVELVLASSEAMTFSVFGKVSFLWNVGESSFGFVDENGVARFDYEVDEFRVRPGGGLRLAWRRGI